MLGEVEPFHVSTREENDILMKTSFLSNPLALNAVPTSVHMSSRRGDLLRNAPASFRYTWAEST